MTRSLDGRKFEYQVVQMARSLEGQKSEVCSPEFWRPEIQSLEVWNPDSQKSEVWMARSPKSKSSDGQMVRYLYGFIYIIKHILKKKCSCNSDTTNVLPAP